jgi:hypothetical protein
MRQGGCEAASCKWIRAALLGKSDRWPWKTGAESIATNTKWCRRTPLSIELAACLHHIFTCPARYSVREEKRNSGIRFGLGLDGQLGGGQFCTVSPPSTVALLFVCGNNCLNLD